jgi:hypothetical protein
MARRGPDRYETERKKIILFNSRVNLLHGLHGRTFREIPEKREKRKKRVVHDLISFGENTENSEIGG